MAITMVYGITLMGGLWPFGDDVEVPDVRGTIAGLEERTLELEATPVVPGGTATAREQYREFLSIPDSDPALQMEATRRLGDLNLAAGEDQEIEVGPEAAVAYYAEAVQLYTGLLSSNPDYADTDKILYQLARAYETIGEADLALAAMDRLVAEYPHSQYYLESQFRRGEVMFLRKDFSAAERAYASVVGGGAASTYFEQSLYKRGWSLFKDGEYEQALDAFKRLLDVRLGDVTDVNIALEAMSRPERELLDDALRVIAITFSYQDGYHSLNALLDRHAADSATLGDGKDPAYVGLLYAGLGDLYLDKERYQDAAETYSAFVARRPTDALAPVLQTKVIAALTLAKFPTLVLNAKRDYVTLYGIDGPFWNQRMIADWSEVVDQLKLHLSDLASYEHAEAQVSGDANAYERAAHWYNVFVDWFPHDPDSATRNYRLADIRFELGQYADASIEYRRTAYYYGAHEQAAAAGYAALLSAKKHEEQLDGVTQIEWRQQTLEYSVQFAQTFPEHPQSASVLTNTAELLFQSGDLARSIEVAGWVVTLQPPAEMAIERTAWAVIAHANFDLAQFAQAEQAYGRLLLLPLAAGSDRSTYAERIAAAVYRQAEQAEAVGDIDLAVAEFLRVAQVQPESAFVATAFYDAAALLMNNERWPEAIDILERFRNTFPEHDFNNDVTQKLAVAYGAAGQSGRAASEFERIANFIGVDPELQREALWQAAELYESQASVRDQQRVYEQVVTRFPQPFAESLEAQYRLAELAGEAGDRDARQKWLRAMIAADAGAGAARSARSQTLAAQAGLELAAPARDAFIAIKLTIPLKKSLKLKKTQMEVALNAYGMAADYGIAAVTTAASYEIANLYYVLSQDLIDSERPAELSVDELEQYEILLEEQAFPFEEQAIEIFSANAARAADGVYDTWVKKSFARLAELMPFRYAKAERREAFVAALD